MREVEEQYEMKENFTTRIDDWLFKVLPLWLYRLPFNISDFWFYSVKSNFQRLIRKHHLSNSDIWNLNSRLAPYLHQKIKVYRDFSRGGYPGVFDSEEEWKIEIDKMLFAFEFLMIVDLPVKNRKRKAFFERIGEVDYESEVEENKVVLNSKSLIDLLGEDNSFYYNAKKEIELYERAQEGFNSFGKNFTSLWC